MLLARLCAAAIGGFGQLRQRPRRAAPIGTLGVRTASTACARARLCCSLPRHGAVNLWPMLPRSTCLDLSISTPMRQLAFCWSDTMACVHLAASASSYRVRCEQESLGRASGLREAMGILQHDATVRRVGRARGRMVQRPCAAVSDWQGAMLRLHSVWRARCGRRKRSRSGGRPSFGQRRRYPHTTLNAALKLACMELCLGYAVKNDPLRRHG